MLRSLVIANLFVLAAATLKAANVQRVGAEFMVLAAFCEPVLIASLVALCAARRWLHRLPYVVSLAIIAAFEIALAWGVYHLGAGLALAGAMSLAQLAFLTLFVTGCLIAYFDLRSRALAPAVAEARIQALQARIRPHFLYNSINAVLSLMRSDPRRAERALEDMADLFRVLMADNRTLAPIADEVRLARQYLAIESLRLGERLRVTWRTEGMPGDALVPPLVLQPLVENAVYHGIEPLEAGGEIQIEVGRAGEDLVMSLRNPYQGASNHPGGNRMALQNIRERLQLHFDAEASMLAEVSGGEYRVTIRLPYMTAPA
ncbi:MAG TPA: histidine kinase [Usitatibacter sp.]|nr:histidine kinase [Usitatibacter sp.]